MTESVSKPLIPGWGWPVMVVGLLSLNICVCAITVFYALSSSYSVEDNYYEKALAWDEHRAEFADAEALGWSIETTINADMIDVAVLDRAGDPVNASAATGVCFHQAHADDRLELAFTRVGDGRFLAKAELDRPGLWEVRLEITVGDTKTKSVHQINIAGDG